jgi:hypothetical protein
MVCTAVCELAQPDLTSWAIGLDDMAGWLVTQTLTMLGGFAVATLLLNTSASIVVFVVCKYVLPGVFAAAAALTGGFDEVVSCIDFQFAQVDVYEWNLSGTEEWSHLVVSGLLWLAVPWCSGCANPARRGEVGNWAARMFTSMPVLGGHPTTPLSDPPTHAAIRAPMPR